MIQDAPPRLPPDLERCQAQIKRQNFLLMGDNTYMGRCEEKPVVIATENKPHPLDGQKGSMALCSKCLRVMKATLGEDYATVKAI